MSNPTMRDLMSDFFSYGIARTRLHEDIDSHAVREKLVDKKLPAMSLDSQIDAFLIDAEHNAIVDEGDVEEAFDPRMSSHEMLSEADEEPVEGVAADEVDAEVEDEGEIEQEKPKIDVKQFAADIVRLIQNYDNLLDVPSAVMNRATKYLLKYYDKDVVGAFKEIVSRDYDVELDSDRADASESDYDDVNTPFAAGALGGGSGGGIGGGGGGGGGGL